MRLKLKKLPSLSPKEEDPKVATIRDAVRKSRIAKEASEDFNSVKDDLKTHVFPFGDQVTEHMWSYRFDQNDPEFANVVVQYQERTKPYMDIDVATRILKEKRLYKRCLTVPEPAPPPEPFLDEDKIMQLLSEDKLSSSDIRKMIKTRKKDTVKVIIIAEPEGTRGKANSKKSTKTK